MKCPRCGWKINTLSKDSASTIKSDYPNAFSPWTPEQDEILKRAVKAGQELDEICRLLGRQPSALQRRILLFGWKPEPKVEIQEETALEKDSLKYLKADALRASFSPALPTSEPDARSTAQPDDCFIRLQELTF